MDDWGNWGVSNYAWRNKENENQAERKDSWIAIRNKVEGSKTWQKTDKEYREHCKEPESLEEANKIIEWWKAAAIAIRRSDQLREQKVETLRVRKSQDRKTILDNYNKFKEAQVALDILAREQEKDGKEGTKKRKRAEEGEEGMFWEATDTYVVVNKRKLQKKQEAYEQEIRDLNMKLRNSVGRIEENLKAKEKWRRKMMGEETLEERSEKIKGEAEMHSEDKEAHGRAMFITTLVSNVIETKTNNVLLAEWEKWLERKSKEEVAKAFAKWRLALEKDCTQYGIVCNNDAVWSSATQMMRVIRNMVAHRGENGLKGEREVFDWVEEKWVWFWPTLTKTLIEESEEIRWRFTPYNRFVATMLRRYEDLDKMKAEELTIIHPTWKKERGMTDMLNITYH
jgi:hypothetical protein